MPFAGNDTIAATGGDHQLVATCLTPQIGITQYLWSPTTFLKNQVDSIKRKPIVVLSDDQLFVVKITNMIGCSENDSVFVKVFPGPGYNSPNAFTPNGDGVNDIFRVIPAGIDNTIWFKIFNRFGDLVFQSSRWLRGWDGTKNGVKQPPGTYVWMVKGFDVNGKVIQSKGTVILLP
jgi:gliding motility-associated-like protein